MQDQPTQVFLAPIMSIPSEKVTDSTIEPTNSGFLTLPESNPVDFGLGLVKIMSRT